MLEAIPFSDRITITRPGPATQSPATGAITPGGTLTVLTSPCDVQEDSFRLRRTRPGDEYLDADAIVYLPLSTGVSNVKTDDDALVDQEGLLRRGKVVETSVFSSQIIIRWV